MLVRLCSKSSKLGCVDHNKTKKTLKEMVRPDHLTCLLRKLNVGQEATVRSLYGKTDWFRIEKGAWQGCLLSPCLTYIQSISCKMLGWMSYKLESRLLGEIPATSDMQMIPLQWQKMTGTKESLDEGEGEEWKTWIKTQY